ncbi:efflux RND transporter periplasmic adaptor subunit [Rhodoligotrophos ferricapiens]|uniref:efflux RND transporter periplasmic adaptor subunit n=1 Tax=Rhodoligotrophos ferricapiens TaxID=3069264 RepID=UPI00315C5DDA
MKARFVIALTALSLCAGVAIGAGGKPLDKLIDLSKTVDLSQLHVDWTSVVPAMAAPSKQEPPARGEHRARVVPVEVAKVKTASFTDKVEAVGSLRANQSITIVPEAAGRIQEIRFKAGEKVKAGEVLVQLDDRDQRIALEEAKATFAEAAQAYERQKKLVQSKVATKAALEQALATYTKAKAAVERAERDLERQQIVAPFAGVVGLSRTDLGAWVETSTVLTTLDDVSTVELEFALPERLLGEIKTGLAIEASSTGFPGRIFEGEISAVDTRIDPASRAFTVRASIPNPDLALKPGMFVNISVALDKRVAIAVPEEAVMTSGDRTFVYLLADGKAERRPVELGARTAEGLVEVRKGVDKADLVISSGTQTLRDGTAVKVMADSAAQPRTGARS